MNTSLTFLIEALTHTPSQKIKDLNLVIPLTAKGDRPHFWNTPLGPTMDAIFIGKPAWLTILTTPLTPEQEVEVTLRSTYTHTSELFSSAVLLKKVLEVPAPNGKGLLYYDLFIEEAYTPLCEFIRLNCSTQRKQMLRNALQSIAHEATTRFAKYHGITHGKLSRSNICFDSQGSLRLGAYPLSLLNTARYPGDMLALAQTAILIYIAASSLDAYKILYYPTKTKQDHAQRLLYIISAAQHHGIPALATLAKACQHRTNRAALAAAIAELSIEPFRPIPLLVSLLEQSEGHRTAVVISSKPTEVEEDIVPDRIDLATCAFVAQPNDLMIRYCKNGLWGYANHRGEILHCSEPLLAAEDFYEGRAVVRTASGYGLIDTQGRWIMSPIWEDMIWHGAENIVTAMRNGIWHIYDRMGNQASVDGCDAMGSASEGYLVGRRGDKYGYYDTATGQKCVDFIYDEAAPFRNGLAAVTHSGNSYHIDTTFRRLSARREHKLELEEWELQPTP